MKKLLLIAICIVFALCMCGCSYIHFLLNMDKIAINNNGTYYNKEEMENLYYEHKDGFKKVAEIVLKNEKHLEYLKKTNNHMIAYSWDKEFFNDDEWNDICDLLNDTDLWCIYRYDVGKTYGEGAVRFVTIQPDSYEKFFSICYVSENSSMPYILDSSFSEIEDRWYIVSVKNSLYSRKG